MKSLPKGWVSLKASDICQKVQSGSTPRNNPFTEFGDVPYLKVYNIVNQKIDFQYRKQFISKDIHEKKLARSIVYPNDVLMNIVGPPLGKIALVGDEYPEWNINQAITLFRVDKDIIDHKYLFYFLNEGSALNSILGDLKGTVGQINISLTQCRLLDVPLCSLPEQNRIVAKLDEVLAQVDTIKARLDGIPEVLKRFRQSVLAAAVSGKLTEEWRGRNRPSFTNEEFRGAIKEYRYQAWLDEKTKKYEEKGKFPKSDSWKSKYVAPTFDGEHLDALPEGWIQDVLEGLVYISARIGWKGLKASEYTEEGPLFLSVHGLNHGTYVDLSEAFHISEERYRESPEIMLENNDILLCKDGAGIGKIAIVNDLAEKASINSSLLLIRAGEFFDTKFLFYLLSGPKMQSLVHERMTGSAVPHLFQRDVKEFVLDVPPLNEQKEIVRLVDQYFAFADTIEAQVKKAQARVNNLTQSILAKAFRGDLVPQDPDDEPGEVLLTRIAQARKEAEALAKAAKKAAKAPRKTVSND